MSAVTDEEGNAHAEHHLVLKQPTSPHAPQREENPSCATPGPDTQQLVATPSIPYRVRPHVDGCLPGKRGLAAKMPRRVAADGGRHTPPTERQTTGHESA